MEFRLKYRGPLKGNGSPEQKQRIRRFINPQLSTLWSQPPLTDYKEYLSGGKHAVANSPFSRVVGPFTFQPLVTSAYDIVAELSITFLRPEPPGLLVSNSGDIDNRVKTLLDALRMPHNLQELPANDSPTEQEKPFCVLLEDDSLITHLAITTDRLLEPTNYQLDVILIIHVRVKVTRATIDNLSLGV
jgi:hypothetical protein